MPWTTSTGMPDAINANKLADKFSANGGAVVDLILNLTIGFAFGSILLHLYITRIMSCVSTGKK
jgi:large-conductance mechanosensitive channel